MMYKIFSRKNIIINVLFLVITATLLLTFGKQATTGALKGIYLCCEVLVPSLFPFMVLSAFSVKSGISAYFEKYSAVITKTLFGLSGKCGTAIIMSMIGGYPVGARAISALYESGQISEYEAKKAAYFAVGAGPGFLITFVGTNLLGCLSVGICILCAQIISIIILGIMNKYIFRKSEAYNSKEEIKINIPTLSQALIQSTASGVYGILEMCGIIVVFSAVLGIIQSLLQKYEAVYLIVNVLLEVTSASQLTAKAGNILLLSFAVGFGGLCVHFQIFTALKEIQINKFVFFLYRIIQGLLTSAFTYLLLKVFNVSLPVYSSIDYNTQYLLSSSTLASSLLIITGLCFLYTLKKYKE